MSVHVKLIYKLDVWDLHLPPDAPVGHVRAQASRLTGIPGTSLRVLLRGRPCADEATLESLGARAGAQFRLMVTAITPPAAPAPDAVPPPAAAPAAPVSTAPLVLMDEATQDLPELEAAVRGSTQPCTHRLL